MYVVPFFVALWRETLEPVVRSMNGRSVAAIPGKLQRRGSALVSLNRKPVEKTSLVVAGDAFVLAWRFGPRRKRCGTNIRCSARQRLGLRSKYGLRCHVGR